MNKPMHHQLVLALIFAALGCKAPAPSTPADAAPRPSAPKPLGRAGPVSLDLAGVRQVVATARVLSHWRRGEAPDVAALADPALRRRLVIQGLETRVVRHEFARRALEIAPQTLRDALENAARGKPADAPAPAGDPDTLDARLSARYGVSAELVREAVVDVLRAAELSQALVAAVPEAEIEAEWRAENTRLELDVLQIPRVPSSAEITRFVKTRGEEIDLAYEAHRGRFNVPPRAVTHRIVVKTEARAAELRQQIVSAPDPGRAFADAARAQSTGPNARAGGRLGALSAKKLPLAFELREGTVSAPQQRGAEWALYRVERRLPAQSRPKSDASVRRELAAELLRRADELPHAKQVAARVRQRLRQAPDGEQLTALITAERVRRHQTPPFGLTGRSIPGVGLAPELAEAALALTAESPIAGPIVVRQNYVVIRLLARQEPQQTWAQAKADYSARWRARTRPRIVDRWLSKRLKDEPLWVDTERLAALPTESLVARP